MTEFVGYIAMSLDGRIADGTGEVGWLEALAAEDSDQGYGTFYEGIDALVMGRATYDFVRRRAAEWPYSGKPSHVVTSGRTGREGADIEFAKPDFRALRERIAAERRRRVWVVGGGATLRGAAEAGMLDRLRVFVAPVVVGSGPLLFAEGGGIGLEFEASREWPHGFVELVYRRKDQ